MNKPYFCYLSHFATGEGLIESFGFVIADNEDAAKIKFLKSTICIKYTNEDYNEDGLNFWKIGVDIWEVKDESWNIIRQYLYEYLSLGVATVVEKRIKDRAQIDFFFHSYCNYS
jgi:hypothetical protein